MWSLATLFKRAWWYVFEINYMKLKVKWAIKHVMRETIYLIVII